MDAATLAKMSPEEKEAFHRDQESKVKTFAYRRPHSEHEKDILRLAKTRLGGFSVQVLRESLASESSIMLGGPVSGLISLNLQIR